MSKSIKDLQMLSTNEENILKEQFNNTHQDYPRDKCIHTLFEEQVLKTPDKTAVIACDKTLTYDELNRLSNRIAHSLLHEGIGVGDIVAFALPRRSYLIATMFGIFKSGAAYMPIDPDYPQDRIGYMLKDSKAKFFINESNFNKFISDNEENPNVETSSGNICYCIYTSGSTGMPKGTVLMHRNVANYVSSSQNNNVVFYSTANNCKTILSTTTVVFDIFVTESLMPLCNGMTIVFANEEQATIQKSLNELVINNPVDIMQTTPTKMETLIIDKQNLDYIKNLKIIILGGEALEDNLVQKLQEISDAEIFNIYGPTETTVWSTNMMIKKRKNNRIIDLVSISQEDKRKILDEINNTSQDYPKDKCVHQLFEEHVLKAPNKTAVVACDKTLTYDELNRLSNRIANSLLQKGIGVGDIVAFALPRQSYLIVTMLGILKSGAAYMPIDPDYPRDRIDYMLSDSKAKFFITESNLDECISDNEENPNVEMRSDNYCYCIYTSGSTGMPKGTIIMHKNLVNFCTANTYNNLQNQVYCNCKNVLSIGSIIFDILIFETLLSLLLAKTIVLANDIEIKDIERLSSLITKNNVDCIHITPSRFKIYMLNSNFKQAIKKISLLMLGGEELGDNIFALMSDYENLIVLNGYGPTETTLGVSFGDIKIKKQKRISSLVSLNKKDQDIIKEIFNDTKMDYSRDKCVHQLFEEQVLKTPDKTAVIACDKTLTYDELNKLSNRIANSLIQKGIGVGDIVAFALPRRSYLIATMFGILKSGAAYMPLDPSYPKDRIDYMLNDSKAKIFITEENIDEFISCNEENPNIKMTSENICYCIYTSGSTGIPKGTIITHKNLNNFCTNNNINAYQHKMLSAGNRVISTTNICFDIFIFENLLPLINGLSIVLATENEMIDADLLAVLIEKTKSDVFHSTPSKISMLCNSERFCRALKQFKIIMIGAEVFNQELCMMLKHHTNAAIFNGYGPTETTIGVSFAEINEVR